MKNLMKERDRKLRHQRDTFFGKGQTRNKLTMLKETASKCVFLNLCLGKEREKKLP